MSKYDLCQKDLHGQTSTVQTQTIVQTNVFAKSPVYKLRQHLKVVGVSVAVAIAF